jgi:hypothetical protein
MLTVLLFLFVFTNTYAQSDTLTCVCFDYKSENIELNFSEDSSLVAFNIIRKGFESQKKRDELFDMRNRTAGEYGLDNLIKQQPLTSAYLVYISIWKPDKLPSLHQANNCKSLISLNSFRTEEHVKSGITNIYLIQKRHDGDYLKWKATLMGRE